MWAQIGKLAAEVARPAVKAIAKGCGANQKTLDKLDVVVGATTGGVSGFMDAQNDKKAGKGGKANGAGSALDTVGANKC